MTVVVSTLRALAYVVRRQTVLRVRRFLRNPVAVVIAVVVAVVWLVLLFAGSDDALAGLGEPRSRAWPVALVAWMVLMNSWNAAKVCPIKLRGPDLAWLVPRPGADRALVLWHVASPTLRIGVFGLLGAGLLTLAVGTFLWQPVAAFALGIALFRGTVDLVHLVALRTSRPLVSWLSRLFWLGVTASAVAAALDRTGLPDVLYTLTSPIREFLDLMVAAVITPLLPAGDLWVVVVVTVVVGLMAVALGTRYEEGAAQRTWEFEAVAAAVHDGSMTGDVMAEAISRQVRKGIPSLRADLGLRGEWALAWRSLAAWRRTWRSVGVIVGIGLAAALLLAFLAPQASFVPVLLLAAFTLLVPQSGMIEEADHVAIYRVPGSAFRKAVAVDCVGVAAASLSVVVVALPWALATGMPWQPALVGTVAITAVVAAVTAVGGTASLWGNTVSRKFGLSVVGVLAVIVVLAGVSFLSLAMGLSPLPGLTVVASVIALLAWHASGRLVQ